MPEPSFRIVAFLFGLFTLLSWELAAPDHPPAASRPRRWFANLGLAAINGGVVSLTCLLCLAVAEQRLLPWRYGLFEVTAWRPWLRWPGEIALLDLLVYGLHRLYHRVPVLWRFHRVHHSDLDLDVTSASRFHLGEVAMSAAAKLTLVLALGISPWGLVLFEAVMLSCAQFQHANIRLPAPLERALWATFVPPAMHRIHHRPRRADTDSNFGTVLVAWDRLFGTLRRRALSTDDRFGLPELREERRLGLLELLALPFRRR